MAILILLVSRDQELHERLAQALPASYALLGAATPALALRLASQRQPAAVLLDVDMVPEAGLAAFVASFRERVVATRIVLLDRAARVVIPEGLAERVLPASADVAEIRTCVEQLLEAGSNSLSTPPSAEQASRLRRRKSSRPPTSPPRS